MCSYDTKPFEGAQFKCYSRFSIHSILHKMLSQLQIVVLFRYFCWRRDRRFVSSTLYRKMGETKQTTIAQQNGKKHRQDEREAERKKETINTDTCSAEVVSFSFAWERNFSLVFEIFVRFHFGRPRNWDPPILWFSFFFLVFGERTLHKFEHCP